MSFRYSDHIENEDKTHKFLIYDIASNKFGIATKTLDFYKQCIMLPALYRSLSPNEKKIYAYGLRDLYLANIMGKIRSDEEQILLKASRIIGVVLFTVYKIFLTKWPYKNLVLNTSF